MNRHNTRLNDSSRGLNSMPLRRTAAAVLLLSAAVSAWPQAAAPGYERRPAEVNAAAAGRALAARPGAAGQDVVRGYLRDRGASAGTVASLVDTGASTSRQGVRHLRMQQQVAGLVVHGTYLKAALNANGDLVHLVQNLADVNTAAPNAPAVDEAAALAAVLAQLHPVNSANLQSGVRQGNVTRFNGGVFFHSAPTVTRVAVPTASGGLDVGFLVETWTKVGNRLHHTLVDGRGRVLEVENRTANDSYNVYTNSPLAGPQTLVAGPGAGNTESPSGWLGAGAQTTINIAGNNVSAYLDADANNAADAGGSAVSGGNFTASHNATLAPSTTANRAVAVQNLFFLNNVVHDILYRHGFNEAAGNFQVNNFGLGGLGSDAVLAEAQDGSGTDNANFSTPNDGSRPRMQMYLWSGAGPTHEVVVNGTPYGARDAAFGPVLSTTGIAGLVTPIVDGGGVSNTDGCEAISTTLTGRIALLDRGNCDFTIKVRNAQAKGAVGVIVANNAGTTEVAAMGGADRKVTIPSLMVSRNDGATLRTLAGQSGTLRKKGTAPLQLDGDLDSDIVYHEYGHGLTWRMIGSMSGPLAGAIGEGASDVVAMLINGDDVVGEYSASNPLGIRRYRYAGYPLTYGNVTGTSVHNDGEIYAGTMWRLMELFQISGIPRDTLFRYFVDGMNYTPATPKFENMRDGMLQSVVGNGGAVGHCALVWEAFAQFGIGDGARATIRGSRVTVTPSFAARGDCSF